MHRNVTEQTNFSILQPLSNLNQRCMQLIFLQQQSQTSAWVQKLLRYVVIKTIYTLA